MQGNRVLRLSVVRLVISSAILSVGLWVPPALAGGTGNHSHGEHPVTPGNTTHRQHDAPSQNGAMMSGGHQHNRWVVPPKEYAARRGDRWADAAAIVRGQKLYHQHCVSCHGADGKGTGPLAGSLPHPPADLTHHFHRRPGDGDAYLFWRVSEGGAVEPFKSMHSAMPVFKHTLSEDERWDVLAYVHAYFHQGLAAWRTDERATTQSPD